MIQACMDLFNIGKNITSDLEITESDIEEYERLCKIEDEVLKLKDTFLTKYVKDYSNSFWDFYLYRGILYNISNHGEAIKIYSIKNEIENRKLGSELRGRTGLCGLCGFNPDNRRLECKLEFIIYLLRNKKIHNLSKDVNFNSETIGCLLDPNGIKQMSEDKENNKVEDKKDVIKETIIENEDVKEEENIQIDVHNIKSPLKLGIAGSGLKAIRTLKQK